MNTRGDLPLCAEGASTPCPECARLRSAIARALAVVRRMAGGALHDVRVLLEEAIK